MSAVIQQTNLMRTGTNLKQKYNLTRSTKSQPVKVLHIVESLDTGSVENWLLRMLKRAGELGYHLDWTFYCQLEKPGSREQLAKSLGARIIHTRFPLTQTIAFLKDLRYEVKKNRYEVIHCHHDILSGFYLLALVGIPVRKKIVHIHNADENLPTSKKLKL